MPARPALLGLAMVFALTVSACSSSGTGTVAPNSTSSSAAATPTRDGPLRGCVPACVSGLSQPGELPEGVYQTTNFFGGRLRVPLDGGWTSNEDSSGEFQLARTSHPDDGIFLWEDVYPVRAGQRVNSVPETSAGLLTWMRGSGEFRVGHMTAGKLAGLPAKVFDVELGPGAHNDDPGCPVKICVNFLSYPEWSEPWGLAGTDVQRFYLADVAYGGRKHLFLAVLSPANRQLKAFLATAEPLLRAVTVPATPG